MDISKQKLNILLPVYNEERRLDYGVRETNRYLSEETEIPYILTIVDNGSTDQTESLAHMLCEELSGHVQYLRIAEKGVGAAFRAGVAANECELVGYMDIDLSTDIHHIQQMYAAFCAEHPAEMVNASRWSRQSDSSGRKFYRNITSIGLVWLLKLVFRMRASDAICGFKFFRKECAEALIAEAGKGTNGWFYLIELLLRAERRGMKVVELPVRWIDDSKNSTVHTFALIREYLTQIISLRRRLREGN